MSQNPKVQEALKFFAEAAIPTNEGKTAGNKLKKKLKANGVEGTIKFLYEDGCEVFIHDNPIGDALQYSKALDVSLQVFLAPLNISYAEYNNRHPLEVLYECDEGMDAALADLEVTNPQYRETIKNVIRDYPYDIGEETVLCFDVESYDYKRGYCNTNVEAFASVQDVIDNADKYGQVFQGFKAIGTDDEGDEVIVNL